MTPRRTRAGRRYSPPATLPPDEAACRGIARDLTKACEPLLAAWAGAGPGGAAAFAATLPPHLQHFDAGALLTETAFEGVGIAERDKDREDRYADAVVMLRKILLRAPAASGARGRAHYRLLVDLGHLKEDRAEALAAARAECPSGDQGRVSKAHAVAAAGDGSR